jgi:hypothetical protein
MKNYIISFALITSMCMLFEQKTLGMQRRSLIDYRMQSQAKKCPELPEFMQAGKDQKKIEEIAQKIKNQIIVREKRKKAEDVLNLGRQLRVKSTSHQKIKAFNKNSLIPVLTAEEQDLFNNLTTNVDAAQGLQAQSIALAQQTAQLYNTEGNDIESAQRIVKKANEHYQNLIDRQNIAECMVGKTRTLDRALAHPEDNPVLVKNKEYIQAGSKIYKTIDEEECPPTFVSLLPPSVIANYVAHYPQLKNDRMKDCLGVAINQNERIEALPEVVPSWPLENNNSWLRKVALLQRNVLKFFKK